MPGECLNFGVEVAAQDEVPIPVVRRTHRLLGILPPPREARHAVDEPELAVVVDGSGPLEFVQCIEVKR